MKASEMLKDECCGQSYNDLDGKSDLVKMVEQLECQVADQERRLKDKIRLIKFVDKANSQLSKENKALESQVLFLELRLNKAIAELQR